MSEAVAERLSSLEGRLEVVLGQVDAGLVKADAIKSAARAAEERARGHLKRAQNYAELAQSGEESADEDSFEEAARQYADVLPEGDDEGGEFLSPMPSLLGNRRAGLEKVREMRRQRQ